MNKIHSMENVPLFDGISSGDISKMLGCLSAKTVARKKGDVILLAGDEVGCVGIIRRGRANILNEDADGRVILISELKPFEIFGEVFACAGMRSPVTVEAAEDTEVLFIDYKKITTACPSACGFHTKLIENMLKLMAAKCLTLNRKIDILSKRTIRERLLCFFKSERGNERRFKIPYNREELARFLCVDRSALSNELGKMKSEGIIKFERNEFELIQQFRI